MKKDKCNKCGSKLGGEDLSIFIKEFLKLLEKQEVHPVDAFLFLLQFLKDISREIILNDESELNQECIWFNKFIIETHEFLKKQVEKVCIISTDINPFIN